MKNGYNIERLISLLSCSHCGAGFDESCIGLLEISYDTVMVRIVCKECGKKYVLAFMDLNFSFFEATFGAPQEIKQPEECIKNLDKITYDDVLEAHDFIQNFEENWRRYIDKKQYRIT